MTDFTILAIDINEPTAAQKFAKSLRDTGFAVLKQHPIAPDMIKQTYETWAEFFATQDKFNYTAKPGESAGYFGYKSENAKDSQHKDLKEFFHVYQNGVIPPQTEQITRVFNQQMIDLGQILLGWLDEETPDTVKLSEPIQNMVANSDQNLLRVLHYPPLDKAVKRGETRAAEHGDINLITLLVAGTEPGLQAKDTQGNWHDVPTETNYIAVNAGDMLEQATKGYYPSTPHRVINPKQAENRSRYSMPLFMHPRKEVVLDHQTAGEFLEQRLQEIGLK